MAPEQRVDATLTTGPDESGLGMLLDRYHPLQRIGEGAMGEVWLAEQEEPMSCGRRTHARP